MGLHPEDQAQSFGPELETHPQALPTEQTFQEEVPETVLLSKAASADVISPKQPRTAGAGDSPTPLPPTRRGSSADKQWGLGYQVPLTCPPSSQAPGSQGEVMMNSTSQETSVLALDLLRPTVMLGESLPSLGR